jgi:hypothetical protein
MMSWSVEDAPLHVGVVDALALVDVAWLLVGKVVSFCGSPWLAGRAVPLWMMLLGMLAMVWDAPLLLV